MLAHVLRATVPSSLRAKARKYRLTRWLLSRLFAGVDRHRLYGTPYTLSFPARKMPGFGAKLATAELAERSAASGLIHQHKCRFLWDVGANVGLWTLHLASLAPTAIVTSFEPDPDNIKWLEKNISLNGLLNRVAVRPVAVSNKIGTADFFADKYSGSTGSLEQSFNFIEKHYGVSRSVIRVPVITLDQELDHAVSPPDFLKIDVEGHELAVLQGARRLLAQHRPIILLEVNNTVGQVADLLREYGYSFERPDGSRIDPTQSTVSVANMVCVPT